MLQLRRQAARLAERRAGGMLSIPQARWLHTSSPMWEAASPRKADRPVVVEVREHRAGPDSGGEMTPSEIVAELDRSIVGQAAAKRAVANALRNRWRRRRVMPASLREEIVPKNILMIGPTGCGKTEIARRLAKLADAPFVKVEATKFTEVGFHGRDVDQIVRDLADAAAQLVRARARRAAQPAIDAAVEARIVDALVGEHATDDTKATFRRLYREGSLDDRPVEVEIPQAPGKGFGAAGLGGLNGGFDPSQASPGVQEMVIRVDRLFGRGGAGRGGEPKRRLKVSEARPLLEEAEADRFVSAENVAREAVTAAEQDGIVFIDEIDKIVSSPETRYGADASSEGVQRDLLPIIEGSVVQTKHGNVKTDHVLFIASGAFHSNKPSDMMAELQGRLPIRVELQGLGRADLERILTQPEANVLRQQAALLATEGVDLVFADDAVAEIARVAAEVNASVENIGARRLHTIIERVVEEVSFQAPDLAGASAGVGHRVVVDAAMVRSKIDDLLKKQDLSKFVL